MSDKVYNVLFLCTHNSARSIMAEGILNSIGGGRFRAFSAGSQASGRVQPLALQALRGLRVPVDGFRSKDWAEFAFTVCDRAAGETCPLWPGQPMTAHWGVPDPAEVVGSDEQRAAAYWDAATTLRRRIELMLALPLASLDRMALQREVSAIGRA